MHSDNNQNNYRCVESIPSLFFFFKYCEAATFPTPSPLNLPLERDSPYQLTLHALTPCNEDMTFLSEEVSTLTTELLVCSIGSLAGDYGFDPLGLGEDPEELRWYVQAELVHSRFAMAGVAGMLFTDVRDTLRECLPCGVVGNTGMQ